MVEGGGSVIAAFFLAHNYVSEQFGNYVEYGMFLLKSDTHPTHSEIAFHHVYEIMECSTVKHYLKKFTRII